MENTTLTTYFVFSQQSSSPYINRFLSADTIVPRYANPQSLNRYAYTLNNPLRYTDPTGHRACEDYGGTCLSEKQVTKKYEAELHKNKKKHFDSRDLFNQILPNQSPDQLRDFAASADKLALGIDIGAEAGVLTMALGTGILGGLVGFEGEPVTGPAAFGAGWILGETLVQPVLQAANFISTVATSASILADAKTGETGIYGDVSASGSNMSLNATVNVSSNTKTSSSLTSVGWAANLTELSLPLQALAVKNDQGKLSSFITNLYPSNSFNLNVSISP